jgi:adenosylcobinamide-phosphate synthase
MSPARAAFGLGLGRAGTGVDRAAGLGLGLLADATLGDPSRWHPVAGVGQLATGVERALYAPRRRTGAMHLTIVAVPLTAGALAADRVMPGRAGRILLTALLTWTALGARSLQREAVVLSRQLGTGDLEGARRRMPHLVGRDPATLDASGMARAGIESVAENTADAAVGPLFWGALTGPAGAVGYRIVNTLDAMVGHHSERYERFGYAAARADDLVGLVPARLTAALAALLAGRVGGEPRDAWRIWRRDAPAHPSPNAGPCEASFAGALGVRLGGPTSYPYGLSARPWHGDGRDPAPADLDRAARLSREITFVAGLLGVLAALALAGRRP